MDTKTRIRTAGIYIPLLTGTLSVIGSGSILYSIWARRSTKLKDPQHRILGMMSIFDILYSINKALMFLTYPAGLGVPTFGNVATCSLQGFFTQFGYAAGSYNLVLSLYYFLIINKGMKKEEFARVWEKVLHAIIVICHLTFAIVGVAIGLYNPTPAFCYIAPGPYDCTTNPDVPCPFETTAPYFYEVFAQGWIQLAYVGIIVTNLLIWLSVRRQEKRMKKYQTQLEASRLSDMEKKSSYARSVFVQSILYVGAFFLSWSWATIFHLVNWITGVSVPWITLLINTFLPLQGFFNAFIYARPRYIRLKKKNGHMGFRQLIKLVFLPDDGRGKSTVANQDRNSTLRNSSTGEVGSDRNVSKKDSNMFKSFLSSLNRKNNREASNTSVSVSEPKEKTITWSDKKPAQDADEEEGKVEEGEETNGDVSPEGSSSPTVEEEKSVEG
uniref:G-protein coupled receptors family 1 profile domain-containing protein n=1 Tax=Skeletonema marinoi TaxID=267567 RepID=A0A7S2K929_9STRA|mmetsp:Transcript_10204/g.17248  ORF Transcript_10204/g.17248 Transcript_10204/m.17248 type:complete len:441 (+) Transcript_10204:154-1476(+)